MPTPLEIRIRKIQEKIKVPQTGVFDAATCDRLEILLGFLVSDLNLTDKKKGIQKKLGLTGKSVDGIFGVVTVSRIEAFLDDKLPPLPKGAVMVISKKSAEMILEFEIGSRKRYLTKYRNPVWPEGDSGITIGIGYDLGYASPAKFEEDWKKVLVPVVYNTLKNTVGLKGKEAKAVLTSVKNVVIPLEAALEIFYTKSLPEYAKRTVNTFPGVALLAPDVQGALLSLVYNRGTATEGPSRLEMRNIKQWVLSKNQNKIAEELRKMKRLWPKSKGLRDRRDREADLVKNAQYFLLPEAYIFV